MNICDGDDYHDDDDDYYDDGVYADDEDLASPSRARSWSQSWEQCSHTAQL